MGKMWGKTYEPRLCTKSLNIAKNDEIKTNNKFTGTATQPQRDRKLCQFNKDQYCICHNEKQTI